MAFKSKAAAVMSSPNVIPMADVMLVLLIIFMVIMPMIVNGGHVNMAKAVNAENMPNAEKDDAVIVAIARDGRYYLSPGNREVALSEISSDVKDLIADKADKTVFVRSDSRAKYGDVVKAVDEIRSAGVDNVGLLTEKVPPRSTPLNVLSRS